MKSTPAFLTSAAVPRHTVSRPAISSRTICRPMCRPGAQTPHGGALAGGWTRSKRLTPHATGAPMELVEDAFEKEVLESDIPVLVDFYAPWCGPCKLVSPLMEWAAATFDGKLKVVKVNTAVHERFVKMYKINGLPTLAVFRGGEMYGFHEGVIGIKELDRYLQRHAPGLDG